MLKYKGYHGKVEFDDQAGLFHGEVVDLRDVITFQGKSVDELEQAFRDSVDDYLEFCQQRNEVAGQALFWASDASSSNGGPSQGICPGKEGRKKPE
jgi:predicted RNase H-like HicB family nuclease